MTDIDALKRLLVESGYAGSVDFDSSQSFGDSNIDSLDVFAWISSLEEAFDIKIADHEIELLTTPKNLLDLINSKIS